MIDRAATLFIRNMLPARSARGVAHRALQIARRCDLQHAKARVLLMLRAQSAIERAAKPRLNRKPRGHFTRREKLIPIKPFHIAANKVLTHTMHRAPLAKINPPPTSNNLRRNQLNPILRSYGLVA